MFIFWTTFLPFVIIILHMAVSILFLGWTDNRLNSDFWDFWFGTFLKYMENAYKMKVLSFSCRFLRKFIRLSGGLTCWIWKKPIGRDENRFSRVWVLYRDWLYRRRISKKFWRAKMGGGCWRYRRPIERDDSREWLVWLWYRSWRKFGSRKCLKNRVKWRILLVWDAPQRFWSEA